MKKNRLKIKIKGKQYARPFYIEWYRSAWPSKTPYNSGARTAMAGLATSGISSGKALLALSNALSGYADALDRRLSEIDFTREDMHEPVPYTYDPDAPFIGSIIDYRTTHINAAQRSVLNAYSRSAEAFRLDWNMLRFLPDPETYPNDRFRMAGLVPVPEITTKFAPDGTVTIQDHFFRKVKRRNHESGEFIYAWEKE